MEAASYGAQLRGRHAVEVHIRIGPSNNLQLLQPSNLEPEVLVEMPAPFSLWLAVRAGLGGQKVGRSGSTGPGSVSPWVPDAADMLKHGASGGPCVTFMLEVEVQAFRMGNPWMRRQLWPS